ncbi:DNA polymerase III subunit gamma/tau [Amphritea balenae]|uniref:DNA polymerase III subunit gamma/tau n=1 Tax=Amphritea balenae TaxID=452629 RepID=A0A3P1SS74_9GAMM|nr:DNA polymerase III subunit gamma/tau [Amphritea balenae]RRC99899.1 DNA polymerase III subunit gamma/tau [Amphritea balenae]GGK74920.1 DNA polymerase III subunit gamma/tau [Amphritea balenae]
MSYQVLARKWRPAKFQEMVGQEHVLKALVNALDDDRLHHAYLFTGTRGVGKTSIARLFAKSLNCETGVSSTPCGECSACREISEGRFVDLIEVDAASRTKVEDTRELLENVQYAPTHGRFKVYLIDEVHMLSTHSFNALLKTLEEPPPHVKFLLATTDPQKLPVTILSRCLQFNLKNMIPERIVEHLARVLEAENIPFEEPALWLLARSADGSMRDALSLTDQAIAFGAGEVVEADVRAMLGTIDQRLVYRLVDCLAEHNGRELLTAVDDLSRFSPDYNTVLGDLISLLHRIALAQIVPDAVDTGLGDKELVLELAAKLTAEDVQLFYQTALMGRKDLPFVPDAREGLEMVLMRMLAFRPASVSSQGLSEPVTVSSPDNNAADVAPVAQTGEAESSVVDSPAVESPIAKPTADEEPAAPELAPQPSSPPGMPRQEAAPQIVPQTGPQAAPQEEPPQYDESYMQGGYEDLPEKKSEPAVNPQSVAGPAPVSSEQLTPPVDLPWEDNSPAVETVIKAESLPEAEVYSENAEPTQSEVLAATPAQTEQVAVETAPGLVATTATVTNTNSSVTAAASIDELSVCNPFVEVSQNLGEFNSEQWVLLVDLIGLTGMTYSIAANTSLESTEAGWLFHYTAEQKALINETHTGRISEAIGHYFNSPVEVTFNLGDFSRETPSQYRARKKAERQVLAVQSIETDPVVQTVIERFSGRIDLESVQPID